MPIVPIPYVQFGIGALLVIVSLPLCFKLVPRNCFYGVRIRKAFVSDANWYAINSFGGTVLVACGLFLMFFAYMTWDIAPQPRDPLAAVDLMAPLPVLALALIFIQIYARKLPDE